MTILLSVGGESTTSLLGNAVRMLAEDPESSRTISAEISIWCRSSSRKPSGFKPSSSPISLHDAHGSGGHGARRGRHPGRGDGVVALAAGNRDEKEFEHPDEVDLVRRSPRRHVAFGRGIHHCVGAPLARIEARNVLSVLLDRTSSISLDPEHPPRWVDSFLVRRHQDLPVRLQAR